VQENNLQASKLKNNTRNIVKTRKIKKEQLGAGKKINKPAN
jgi:hypothetical protein